MKINNCTSCGGKIEFSPNDKAIKCINCGNLYPIELKKEVRKHAIGWLPSDEELKNGVKIAVLSSVKLVERK